MVALVHCCEQYGPLFRNLVIRFGVDNSGVCYAVNKQSSSCPFLMSLLRRLANAQCTHNFDVVAVHVSRKFNELADMLTRFQVLQEVADVLPDTVRLPDEPRPHERPIGAGRASPGSWARALTR